MAMVIIFLVVLTDILGYGIVIPLLPQIAIDYNISGFYLGFLMAIYPIAQFFSAPILGAWSDQIGRKPVLVISKAGTVLSYIMFALANNYWWLWLSKLIDGATGGNIPAARAYISDNTTPDKRAKGMALIGVSFGLGLIIGPSIGSAAFLIDHNIFWPGMIGAGLSLISMLLTVFFLKEDKSKFNKNNLKIKFGGFNIGRWLNNVRVRKILIIQLVVTIVFSMYQASLIFFTNKVFNFGTAENGKLLTIIGILSVVVQGGLLQIKTFPAKKSVYVSIVMSLFGFWAMGLNHSLIVFYFLVLILSLGGSLLAIYIPTWLSTQSDKDPEGELMGAYESFGSLGRIIGPAISGSLVMIYPRQLFLAMALVLFVLTFGLGRNKMRLLPK